MNSFKLSPRANQLLLLSRQYLESSYTDAEKLIMEVIAPIVKRKGFVTKEQFLAVCKWKTPRTQPLCRRNSWEHIEEVSRISFSTDDEQRRIDIWRLLDGVNYPTASVFLHMFHHDPYPIIDSRALESLSSKAPNHYTFDFWWEYTQFCRALSAKHKVDMRTLDRALWMWSKEK